MKKLLIIISVIGLLVLGKTASAQIGMMGGYWQNGSTDQQLTQNQALNNVLQEIYKSHNVSGQAQIDCSKLTDDQLEKLGEAYLNAMAPNGQQRQTMSTMMGGEGSDNLKAAEINMGRSYIGCWSNYASGPLYLPMMGGSMVNNGPVYGNYYPANMIGRNGYGWNMMSGFGYLWFGWVTMILVWVLLLLGIVAAVKWLKNK